MPALTMEQIERGLVERYLTPREPTLAESMQARADMEQRIADNVQERLTDVREMAGLLECSSYDNETGTFLYERMLTAALSDPDNCLDYVNTLLADLRATAERLARQEVRA